MKKIILCTVVILGLAGCGNKSSSEEAVNEITQPSIESTEKDELVAREFNVYTIPYEPNQEIDQGVLVGEDIYYVLNDSSANKSSILKYNLNKDDSEIIIDYDTEASELQVIKLYRLGSYLVWDLGNDFEQQKNIGYLDTNMKELEVKTLFPLDDKTKITKYNVFENQIAVDYSIENDSSFMAVFDLEKAGKTLEVGEVFAKDGVYDKLFAKYFNKSPGGIEKNLSNHQFLTGSSIDDNKKDILQLSSSLEGTVLQWPGLKNLKIDQGAILPNQQVITINYDKISDTDQFAHFNLFDFATQTVTELSYDMGESFQIEKKLYAGKDFFLFSDFVAGNNEIYLGKINNQELVVQQLQSGFKNSHSLKMFNDSSGDSYVLTFDDFDNNQGKFLIFEAKDVFQ